VDSGGPKEAQVQSNSPVGANVPSWEGTFGVFLSLVIASAIWEGYPGEYD